MPAAAHSIEADLRAVREAAGLTIEDIHRETRLATDIIQRFEAGNLIGDPSFNSVYLKAFLRSYGEAVGLLAHEVEKAWVATQAGTYQGTLHPAFSPLDSSESDTEATSAYGPERPSDTDEAHSTAAPPKHRFPAVDPLTSPGGVEQLETAAPSTYSSSAAKPRPRLQTQRRASSGSSFDSAWGAILGVTVVIVMAVLGVLWILFRESSPHAASAPDEPDTTEVAVAADQITPAASGQTAAPQLSYPIEITVLAGGDGLQGFRVTEAPAERRPVWVEPGDSVVFSSAESVILWGEGATGLNPNEVTLRFQGYEWRPPAGQILRIDGTDGPRLLDSLRTAFPEGGGTAR